MLKRIGLFLLTNMAIVLLLSVFMFIVEKVFGIHLTGYSYMFVVSLFIGFAGSFISLWMSRWMAKKTYKITLINDENIHKLESKEKIVWDTVKTLAEKNNIKMPEVGIYVDEDPNAFATGATKNSSLVAVSTALLSKMNETEIEGVIGHEMAHILNGDMVTMTLLQGVLNTFVVFLSRVIGNLAAQAVDENLSTIVYFLVNILLQIALGLLASMITMAYSRHREFRADEGSAMFVGKEKMIAGLKALQNMTDLAGSDKEALAAMKISTAPRGGLMKLLSSHPDLEARISNLEAKSF